MPEAERTTESELSPEWKEAMRAGIEGAVEDFELFDRRIDVAPLSVSDGKDDRFFPDLSREEQIFIEDTFFSVLKFDPNDPDFVTDYETEAPEKAAWSGKATVMVFRTAHSDDREMFLHKIHFPDGKVDYVVAPADFRL